MLPFEASLEMPDFSWNSWNISGITRAESKEVLLPPHIKHEISLGCFRVQFRMISRQTTTNFGIMGSLRPGTCILAMIPLSSFVASK